MRCEAAPVEGDATLAAPQHGLALQVRIGEILRLHTGKSVAVAPGGCRHRGASWQLVDTTSGLQSIDPEMRHQRIERRDRVEERVHGRAAATADRGAEGPVADHRDPVEVVQRQGVPLVLQQHRALLGCPTRQRAVRLERQFADRPVGSLEHPEPEHRAQNIGHQHVDRRRIHHAAADRLRQR